MKRFVGILICIVAVFVGCSNNNTSPKTTSSVKTSDSVTVTQSLQTEKIELSMKFASNSTYHPLNFKCQKAVWFSYIDIADMLTNKTKTQFQKSISEAFENVKDLSCNTVYVHVRPFGDAFYNSQIYPQTRFYTGKVLENSPYDAFEIMVEEAHRCGLSIHAWINPLRCEKEEYFVDYNDEFLLKKWYNSKEYNGKYLVKVDDSERLWLNPAYKEVRKLICDGITEIIRNYNVDGIHIDDYFYPTTDENFDIDAFSQSSKTSLSDFRLNNTTALVSEIYQAVKKENENVLFGISPQGNISNNYNELYADVKRWAGEKGFCDYIVPQIYYGFENEYQPFETVLKQWNEITCDDVKLVIGLAYYKIHTEGEFMENTGIISRQFELSQSLSDFSGVAFYNYKNIFETKNANSDVELARLKEKMQFSFVQIAEK